MSETEIRVVSLNCWGLKFVAKHREQRIRAIASELCSLNYDIVALQELWVSADYELVRNRLVKHLPYSRYFYSGALGSGLALFSRFPITSTSIHPYSLNGSPIDVAGGDWFVGKAAASIVVSHPTLKELEVFNTHLFAKGGEEGPEYNRAHRLVNAWELAKLVRISAERGRHVIVAGDFNSVPTTLPITVIKEHAGLKDSWQETNRTPTQVSVASPTESIQLFGVTADSPLNFYSAGKPLDPYARRHQGKRLDYIMYREPATISSSSRLRCTQTRVVFTSKVPGQLFSFSDHFGLEAIFSSTDVVERDSGTNSEAVILPCVSDSVATSVIHALTECYRHSNSRSRFELGVFLTCVLMLLALIIGTAWLPKSWINPIFIFVTAFVTWLGTTMLYAGFIYGNWERRALTNIIEELEMYRSDPVSNPGSFRNGDVLTEAV